MELEFIQKDGSTKSVDINNSSIIIGRARSCNVQLADLAVSRIHCMVEMLGSQLTVTDLSSKNGIKINGQRARKFSLKVGDVISIGETICLLNAP